MPQNNGEILIEENINKINRRNLASALSSLEETFSLREGCLRSIVHSIHVTHERLISSFSDQLFKYRLEFSASHDSYKLLEKSVEIQYNNLKNKKMSAMRQLFADSRKVTEKIKQIQDKSMNWTLTKMESTMAAFKAPNFRLRLQKDMRALDSTYERVCDTAFKNFQKRSTANKRDEYWQEIDGTKRSIYRWKMSIITVSEEWINAMLGMNDNCYSEYIEELHAQLSDLQQMSDNLTIYKLKLAHLSRHARLELDRFERFCRYDEGAAVRMIQQSAGPSNNFEGYQEEEQQQMHCLHPYSLFARNQSDAKLLQADHGENDRASILIGTRIRSLGLLAGLSLEYVEAILMELIVLI